MRIASCSLGISRNIRLVIFRLCWLVTSISVYFCSISFDCFTFFSVVFSVCMFESYDDFSSVNCHASQYHKNKKIPTKQLATTYCICGGAAKIYISASFASVGARSAYNIISYLLSYRWEFPKGLHLSAFVWFVCDSTREPSPHPTTTRQYGQTRGNAAQALGGGHVSSSLP